MRTCCSFIGVRMILLGLVLCCMSLPVVAQNGGPTPTPTPTPTPSPTPAPVSKYRGFGIVRTSLAPADNSGVPQVKVELVNGAQIAVAAYGITVNLTYADGSQAQVHQTVDMSQNLDVRRIFPASAGFHINVPSLLPKQHAFFEQPASPNASGQAVVAASGAITAVLFADGSYRGDPIDLGNIRDGWNREFTEMQQWLPQIEALRTSQNIIQDAAKLTGQMAATPVSPGIASLARKNLQRYVVYAATAGQPLGTIQGYKINKKGIAFSSPGATITIDGAAQFGPSINPYTPQVMAVTHTVTSDTPAGYAVSYSVCVNCTDHTDAGGHPFVGGNSVKVQVPAAGYVDLWWKYSPSAGAPAAPAPATSGAPITPLAPTSAGTKLIDLLENRALFLARQSSMNHNGGQ